MEHMRHVVRQRKRCCERHKRWTLSFSSRPFISVFSLFFFPLPLLKSIKNSKSSKKKQEYNADAVLHFGMHGTVEWLPGAPLGSTGLSWPDVLLSSLPNVYVYAANNPSESIIAKRRGFGTIVSHNVPPYGRAGLYKQLAQVRIFSVPLFFSVLITSFCSTVCKEKIVSSLLFLCISIAFFLTFFFNVFFSQTPRLPQVRDLISEYNEDPSRNGPLRQPILESLSLSGLRDDIPYTYDPHTDTKGYLTEEEAEGMSEEAFTEYAGRIYAYLRLVENRLFSEGEAFFFYCTSFLFFFLSFIMYL
jgi:hypothetical protein